MGSRIRSGDAHRLPQLVIVGAAQRVSDQMGTGVIVNESPRAVGEFPAFGFAFDRGGTRGGRDEFWEVGFGYGAFETGQVTAYQGDDVLGGELVPET